MEFTVDENENLKSLLSTSASRKGTTYLNGRSGHLITPRELQELGITLLRKIFNDELQYSVLHYFAGSRELILHNAEVLRTKPRAPAQARHADVSTGAIKDATLDVSTIRLVVVCLISLDGPVTTEVIRLCRPARRSSYSRLQLYPLRRQTGSQRSCKRK